MFKKPIETPQKSPRFDGTSIDDVHVPSFNILSQTLLPKTVEIPATAKESVIPANQKRKKRKGKTLVETPPDSDLDFVSQTEKKKRKKSTNVEVAQTSKPSTRRKTKKKESKLPKYKNPKKVVRQWCFDMGAVEIDAKYHRERYATILWHYGKTKNEDGAITTGMVASKFGGPRIAKKHVPDTTNYPTPRPPTRNLK
ncbi:hypothetical protein H5410_053814 [Solanum commersonii]|uniref:Uncharacterized protein n=1 Tax=Solanum commersonii TaxID=4109 RepID=A0A9J5X4W6_SOLCO|nr:hypothetical protein H5410_053814 [Solanum commersonii]